MIKESVIRDKNFYKCAFCGKLFSLTVGIYFQVKCPQCGNFMPNESYYHTKSVEVVR